MTPMQGNVLVFQVLCKGPVTELPTLQLGGLSLKLPISSSKFVSPTLKRIQLASVDTNIIDQ